jgi:DNA polymerase-3 subunit delta
MAKAGSKARPEFVFVVAGKEPTLVNAKCTEVIDRLIPPNEKATGLWVADADRVTVSEVLDELRTMPFLTRRRVVVLRNADRFISARGQQAEGDEEEKPAESNNREILEKYFENPCPTGVLVMTVSSWPSNTRLARKLSKIGTLVEAKPPKREELPHRLIAYARDAYDKRLEYGAAELLVELAGDDITRLYTEVDKLAAYAANDKAITAGHVESLVGYNRMYNAFAVIESCLQRKTAEAVERLRKMFAEDKSADYTTVGAFAYHFRRLFNVKKMLQEGLSEYQISKKLWLGYNRDAQFALLRRLSLKQIGSQIQQLAETDYAIKKGLAQPRIAMEQLVLRIAAM